MIRYALGVALLFATGLVAVEPFFAPAQPTGSVTVKLHPTEGLGTSTARLVTLGLPFPRGSISAAQLSTVRVLKGGVEQACFVEQLTPWRHVTNTAIDGASVRVARIQFMHTPAVTFPNSEDVIIEWGVTARSLNLPSLTNPRNGWHQVTTAPWIAADNVFEPDVYAVLPKSMLAAGAISARRMDPLDAGVPDTRENPATTDAIATWPGYTERDHAQHNFFYSLINEDDPGVTVGNQCPFKTDFEPWLYDRGAAMFALYLRSGNFKHLREAVRNTLFYKGKLYPDSTTPASSIGGFSIKDPNPASGVDSKYSYNECLAYHYWLTGDNDVYAAMDWVVACQQANAPNSRWAPAQGFWTERSVAFKLLANVVLYEVKGDTAARTRIITQTDDLIWHQDGASGTSPAIPSTGRIDGGLYHYGSQHGDGTAGAFLASGWMSVLLQDAMIRAYAFMEDADVAAFIRRMGNFLRVACKSDTGHQYGGGALYYVDYMMRYDGVSDVRSTGEEEHSLEMAAALAWSWYFSELTGVADASMKTMADNCYDVYDLGVNHWIRPAGPASGLTAYRISPWRKYGWEHRPSGSLSWLMAQTGGTGTAAPAITSSAVTSATESVFYSYTVTTTGAPTPTVSVAGEPAWLILTGNTLSGTPATADVGTTGNITVTASNGIGTPATQVFTITVQAAGTGGGGGGGGGGSSGGGGGGCVTSPFSALAPLALLALALLRRKRRTQA